MGTELFGVDIAGIVADALGDGLPEALVMKGTGPADGEPRRDPNNLSGGLVRGNPIPFRGSGFWEDYTGMAPPAADIKLFDRRAVLIGDTFKGDWIPGAGDNITIDGETRFVVRLEKLDPARAVYAFQCRDHRGDDKV